MDFTASTIITGLLFGVIGYWIFREGKRKINYQLLFIGIGLMVFPPLPSAAWQQWGVGCGLCALAYWVWE